MSTNLPTNITATKERKLQCERNLRLIEIIISFWFNNHHLTWRTVKSNENQTKTKYK